MDLDLENIRSMHEDIERLEFCSAKVMTPIPKSHKETLFQQHVVYEMREKIIEKKRKLNEIYSQNNNPEMKKKIEQFKGKGILAFESFFNKMKELKEFYEENSNLPTNQSYLEMENPKMPQVNFSPEENNGKYLDLIELFETYINTKFFKNKANYEKVVQEFSYRSYVSSFYEFTAEKGKDDEYKEYLEKLMDYIVSFIKRSKPLFPIEKTLKTIDRKSVV